MKTRFFFIFLFFYLSCRKPILTVQNTSSRLDLNLTFDSASWNPKILAVIDSFATQCDCEKCIYELYVNKVLPNYLIINIKARSPSAEYLKKQDPLFVSTIKARQFYIYSGLEDVLIGDQKKIQIATDTSIKVYMNWTIISNGDSMEINKNGGYPFFPSNDENPYYNKLRATDSPFVR